jgi:hypothetical protein
MEAYPDDLLRMDACLSVAAHIVEQIEMIACQGKLELLQDNASCLTSVLVVFLRKVSSKLNGANHQSFWRLSTHQQSHVVQLLKRLLVCHERAAAGDAEAAPAFVARFIRRVLSAMGTQSRVASRYPSPAAQPADLCGERSDNSFLAELVRKRGVQR